MKNYNVRVQSEYGGGQHNFVVTAPDAEKACEAALELARAALFAFEVADPGTWQVYDDQIIWQVS